MVKNNEKSTPAVKAAIVDIQWILNNLPSFSAVQAEQQQNLAALQNWAQNVNAQIAQQTVAEEKQKMILQGQNEFAQRQQAVQQNYAQKIQAIDDEVTKMIADTAKELGYDMVFAKTTLVYGGTDITAQVAAKIKRA